MHNYYQHQFERYTVHGTQLYQDMHSKWHMNSTQHMDSTQHNAVVVPLL